jgi:hypothetical protein
MQTSLKLNHFMLILSLLSYSLTGFANPLQCESLFNLDRPFSESIVDLRSHFQTEIKTNTLEQNQNKNIATLKTLQQYTPPIVENRLSSITVEQAAQLIKVTRNHEVAGYPGDRAYERPSPNTIGYCFGRATYTHLMLLKMGVQKESIRKVWVVGSMLEGKVIWEYHVATAVYTKEKGWVVLDTEFSYAITIEDWVNHSKAQNTNENFRFYVTPAEKFNFTLGKYTRIQMGLNLPAEQDWYKNYFVELLKSIREANLTELGLTK